MNDIVLHKVATIERCLKRIKDVYEGNPQHLKDFTRQDSIILNIQRACEATIDLAMHIVSEQKLGIPKTSREAFELLQKANIIELELAESLMNMVGFRNVAVHDYQALNVEVLESIIEKHLDDFKKFTKMIL